MSSSIFKIEFFVWKEFPNGFVWWKNVPIFAKSIFGLKYAKKMGGGAKEGSASWNGLKEASKVTFFGNPGSCVPATSCCGSCNLRF